ncbi:hypothetical protein [Streptomyces sp. HUAS TT7]|uniref:hypothetical protein n=1 Tax=Streptomyces sp. HUAS TT7 TaxID=3447507 RepID=UPI003F65FAC9
MVEHFTLDDGELARLLFTMHMTPYGEVKLNMTSRLSLSDTTPAEPADGTDTDDQT